MGWHLRFWRRARILPGVTVNLSRSGPSLSLGPRGSKVTIGRKGLRRTIGLPGTGLFATNYTPWEQRHEDADPDKEFRPAQSEPVAPRADPDPMRLLWGARRTRATLPDVQPAGVNSPWTLAGDRVVADRWPLVAGSLDRDRSRDAEPTRRRSPAAYHRRRR